VRRLISALIALAMGLNGLAMLLAGRWWYGAVPGVTATGPFNPHFVKDIGAAYLTVGAAFAWLAAARTEPARGAALAGAAFLSLHGLIHLAEAVGDPTGLADLARDFPAVILPAIVAVWVAGPRPSSSERRHA